MFLLLLLLLLDVVYFFRIGPVVFNITRNGRPPPRGSAPTGVELKAHQFESSALKRTNHILFTCLQTAEDNFRAVSR